ncbi:hypothetical protein AB0J21_18225 [Streptomyces sp. NPDC049954]|uniref:hypothetical protein n=1 Tax=Streptomyces sp. NPDC049954 TaxID=3155779 RepID=UPI00342C96B2
MAPASRRPGVPAVVGLGLSEPGLDGDTLWTGVAGLVVWIPLVLFLRPPHTREYRIAERQAAASTGDRGPGEA